VAIIDSCGGGAEDTLSTNGTDNVRLAAYAASTRLPGVVQTRAALTLFLLFRRPDDTAKAEMTHRRIEHLR
jgi:hypothetical protein